MKEEEHVDLWQNTVQKDIESIKKDQEIMKGDIKDLQYKDREHDKEIFSLRRTLEEIKDDTKWIRRMVTKAIVTAVITGVIGGFLTVIFTTIF
ncbi:hypothetical protein M948_20565 [Virgibacillus sp. CM-4]|uniref:hemolysin XhlA family protein n=1 Tax=Virgibacillus sp. CM-4 TaxID=1354277 RepID=UPI000388358E|nr:hemolysin XhlA family protein [Virgibacillus sp. CM-4]EQB34780.1 hypothetical protein M948_20565 [Virgibacillus sp. CM-4]